MHSKQQNTQQGRRTPLSLAGSAAPASVKEQRQQQHLLISQKAAAANSNGVSGNVKDDEPKIQLQLGSVEAKKSNDKRQHQHETQMKTTRSNDVIVDGDKVVFPSKKEKTESGKVTEMSEKTSEKLAVELKVTESSTKSAKKKYPGKTEEANFEVVKKGGEVISSPVEHKSITPTKDNAKIGVTPVKKSSPTKLIEFVATTVIENQEPLLTYEKSPGKRTAVADIVSATFSGPTVTQIPTATSTPGKCIGKLESPKSSHIMSSLGYGLSPDRSKCAQTFSQIAGRRSIRPGDDCSGSRMRESYRRVNTELDVTSTTNTSLNVTVGSEVENNSSFSFFGLVRKRERTPPHFRSVIELQTDAGELSVSPPKRARLDMYGFLSAVSSPLTMLRSRFSRTSIHTPAKQLHHKLAIDDEMGDVQNVSGVSIDHELPSNDDSNKVTTGADGNFTEEVTDNVATKKCLNNADKLAKEDVDVEKLDMNKPRVSFVHGVEDGKDNGIVDAIGDSVTKNNKCTIM